MPHLTKQPSISLYSMKLSTQLITRRRRRNIHQNLLPMNTEELTSQEDILPRQKPLMMTGRRGRNIHQNLLPMNTEELTSQEDILPRQKPLMMTGWCEESIVWSCQMGGCR